MRLIAPVLLLAGLLSAVVLDRIAVVVERRPIKDSDIVREIRITAYLNGEKPDFSPASRKRAADRLIDQAIIRRELELGRYAEAGDKEVEQLLAESRKSGVPLAGYGITEEQLRKALRWQLTVLRFIDQRFRPRPENAAGEDPFVAWLDQVRSQAAITFLQEELR